VSTNGLISLGASISAYTPESLPVSPPAIPFIAPFWTDVDPRKNNGRVYYRTVTSGRLGTMNYTLIALAVISHNSDLILGNVLLVTELLITETRYLQIVFIVKLLILLRNISRLHWNRELYSFETLQ